MGSVENILRIRFFKFVRKRHLKITFVSQRCFALFYFARLLRSVTLHGVPLLEHLWSPCLNRSTWLGSYTKLPGSAFLLRGLTTRLLVCEK